MNIIMSGCNQIVLPTPYKAECFEYLFINPRRMREGYGTCSDLSFVRSFVHSLTLGRRVTVVVLSFVLFTALQRAALTSSRQLWYEQAKHVDGLQFDSWILLKCFRS